MGRKQTDKAPLKANPSAGWPRWARVLVTIALVIHIAAVVAGTLAVAPSSLLERTAADLFAPYLWFVDQGYGYRYYAPEPPPTPVVTARLQFADGRPDLELRLPDRSLIPRLRYQRHLALANHLYLEFDSARVINPEDRQLRWAQSYARHLCRTYGCARVTLSARLHMIPDLAAVRAALARSGKGGIDLDDEQFYTVPERIGEFACDGL
jgi:hypothetical protein